jgi:hypothetical protein
VPVRASTRVHRMGAHIGELGLSSAYGNALVVSLSPHGYNVATLPNTCRSLRCGLAIERWCAPLNGELFEG